MKARYQYRFYPTVQQHQSLAQLLGCTRVVWNDALALSKASKYPGYNSLAKSLTLSKKTEERRWLNDVSSRSILCLGCGIEHDRDENASKNIEMVGMGHRHDLKCTSRDGKTTPVARPNEA
jgi:transposase